MSVNAFIIDSGAAVGRALARVGTRYTPGGRCLQHNAEWHLNGRTSVFGQQGKSADKAIQWWDWTPEADRIYWHSGLVLPDGLTLFLGPSPTRTDGNRAAGDVVTSYRGKFICTDASGSIVGIMSAEERARQTQRPILGATLTTGGTPTTAGLAYASIGDSMALSEDDKADLTNRIVGALTARIGQAESRDRRESRARLFHNTEDDSWFYIDPRVPSTDPTRVAFSNGGDGQRMNLAGVYQFSADQIANAAEVNRREAQVIIGLARGTDSLFHQPEPSWVTAS